MYTRTGDKGETSLYTGRRVGKESARVEAYGTVDELNSQIGLARASLHGKTVEVDQILRRIQHDLFILGGDLATEKTGSGKVPRITADHVKRLESTVDDTVAKLEKLTRFILPDGGVAGSQLHVARAVCRRAERVVVALSKTEEINPESIRYLNRLSTALFNLARLVNKLQGEQEEEWVHE